MADLLSDLSERIKALGGDWTKYTVVGSFLLYVVGYLALRFHLTAIGAGTDLAVLDERYLFTGARFLVYLVSAVPSLILAALPVAIVVWAARKLVPGAMRSKIRGWVVHPTRLAVFGVVFAVIVIQFVMRQCFAFSNLLLIHDLPREPIWLVRLLMDGRFMPIYFSLLVAACAVPLAILWMLRKAEELSGAAKIWKGLLVFLVGVQVLLLPINYGVLIVDKVVPRVATLGATPLTGGDDAWLIWEGKEGVTFLVRSQKLKRRALVTLPRAEMKRIEILGFDNIVPTLFGHAEED